MRLTMPWEMVKEFPRCGIDYSDLLAVTLCLVQGTFTVGFGVKLQAFISQ